MFFGSLFKEDNRTPYLISFSEMESWRRDAGSIYCVVSTLGIYSMSAPEKRMALPSKILEREGVARYRTETVVWAAPMKLGEYARIRAVDVPPEEDMNADGYIVEQAGTRSNVGGYGGNVIWMVDVYFEDKFEVANLVSKDRGERMMQELSEVTMRLKGLESFLKSEKFVACSFAEQNDLRDQAKAMQEYVWFLSRRVRRLGEDDANT